MRLVPNQVNGANSKSNFAMTKWEIKWDCGDKVEEKLRSQQWNGEHHHEEEEKKVWHEAKEKRE